MKKSTALENEVARNGDVQVVNQSWRAYAQPGPIVSYWNHWPLQSAGRNRGGGSVAEEEVAENEARASVGGEVSGILGELIGELMRKGVLARNRGKECFNDWPQASDCAGILSPQ